MATVHVPVTHLNYPLISGWLHKKSRHMKKWRKRWVILQGSAIFTFKTDTNIISQATEVINLHSCIYIYAKASYDHDMESKAVSPNSDMSDLSYCFEIKCYDVIFTFNAESFESMNQWIHCIEQQLFITSLHPKASKVNKANTTQQQVWICDICAYKNAFACKECEFCGNMKPAQQNQIRIVLQSQDTATVDNLMNIASNINSDTEIDNNKEEKEAINENNSQWQCSLCTYYNIDILPFCEICGALKDEKKQIRRKNTHLSADEVSKDIKGDSCSFNYMLCPCIQRMITILEFYQKWLQFKESKSDPQAMDLAVYQKEIYGNNVPLLRLRSTANAEDLCNFVSRIFDNYSTVLLLDDFNHILDYHCNEQQHDTEKVCAYLLSRFKINASECSISNCVCLQRNHKTDEEHNNKRNELYFIAVEEEQKADDDDSDRMQVVTQQILDRIHCRLIHSFDLFEFTNSEDRSIRNAVNLDENMNETLHLNHNRLQTIKNVMKRKEKHLVSLRNKERIFNSKYTTQISSQPKIVKRQSLIDVTEKAKAQTKESDDDDVTISLGRRCFYWTFYGSNRWFIFAKYNNLKDEVLNNEQHNISLIEYNDLYFKCGLLLKCSKCKQLQCKEKNILNFKYYGLNIGDLFSMDHIMAMLLYCNDDILCHSFISTFTVSEKDVDSFKKAHREYAHFARLMREICECFGAELEVKRGSYYHGISSQQLLFSETIKFCKPTSCASSLSVSLQYLCADDNGLILEIEKNENISDATYYFDTSQCWIFSDFASEMQAIFMGGYKSLKLCSILNIVRAESYKIYLYAIHCLQHLIIGHNPNSKLTKSTKKALTNLIQNEIRKDEDDEKSDKNYLPQYISNLFHFMLLKINYKITLKMNDLQKYYHGSVADLFIETHDDNEVTWCKLDVLLALFPNVDKICIKKLVCAETTMVKLYTFCETINLNKNNKYANIPNYIIKLNEILIADAIFKIDMKDHQYLQQINTLFTKIGWNINIHMQSNAIRLWK